MKKKLFTIVLSAIMVIAMAVPTFAATVPYHYFHAENNGLRLNAYTSSSPVGGTNVTTYSRTTAYTQKWVAWDIANDRYIVQTEGHRNSSGLVTSNRLVLNINNNTFNCNLQYENNLTNADKYVRFVREADSKTGITLVDRPNIVALTHTTQSTSGGYNVTWQAPSGYSNQLWIITYSGVVN